MSRHRPLRVPAAVCWLLAGAAILTGCGTSTPTAEATPPPAAPTVTTAQAAAVVKAYDQQNNAVNAAYDEAGLTGIETPPLRTSSQALMTISKTLRQRIPRITSTAAHFVIPAQRGYPRWFLSISQRVIGGVPAPQLTYDIYYQETPADHFLAAFALTPTEQETVGPFALNSAGAATSVSSGAGLLLAPTDLGRAITSHYVRGLRGKDGFAYSAPLDDVLGNGFVLGRQALGSRGVTLTRAVSSVAPQVFALRTADGGVVAFTAVTVTDRLVAKTAKATASLRAGSNDAALLGKPAGATAGSFTIDRLEMFMTYIPTKASGTKAKVLAYSETGVSVK
ncbi:hypothetical protein AB5J52_07345 [Streptomyces sp. R39]|uniref:DUF8094 domain-containing protein n=1 Tax=Streptomyces sp. R39 TaxID=3238631 RepID=A0AB39QFG7_9ACTN